MSAQKPPGRVDDFTDAFLVSFGVIVFLILLMIHAALGFIWAVLAGYACDKGVTRLARKQP